MMLGAMLSPSRVVRVKFPFVEVAPKGAVWRALLKIKFFLSGEDAENLSLVLPQPMRIQGRLSPDLVLAENLALGSLGSDS